MNASGRRTPATPEGVAVHPVCECHGELMLWQKDGRLTAGGCWMCRVKRREWNRNRLAQRVEWVQAKRDRDPIFRITDLLYRRRRQAMQRKAARHAPAEEGS